MPRLTKEQRDQALGMISVTTVARRFNVKRDTIQKLRRRFQATGTVSDAPRTGRPRVTTPADDNFIRVLHLRDRFKTASSPARECPGNCRSRFTVRRRLKSHGIVAKRLARRSVLLAGHCRARLNWSQIHRRWQLQQWDRVIFSDECRFQLQSHDGRQRIYRRTGERYSSNCCR